VLISKSASHVAYGQPSYATQINDNTKVCLFVCLVLNDTSALFRPLVPRIVEIEHTNHVKNDLK